MQNNLARGLCAQGGSTAVTEPTWKGSSNKRYSNAILTVPAASPGNRLPVGLQCDAAPSFRKEHGGAGVFAKGHERGAGCKDVHLKHSPRELPIDEAAYHYSPELMDPPLIFAVSCYYPHSLPPSPPPHSFLFFNLGPFPKGKGI